MFYLGAAFILANYMRMANNFNVMQLAFYRKYRPRTLNDVLGHEANIGILKNAAAIGRLGHAYLFYGSRGTGKTTTARLIAKLFNCQKRASDETFRQGGEPCNECRTCVDIDSNICMDVVEIDAASNRGIDEIRSLRESIRIAPTSSPHKVYIIDEAHMLTGAAFNALLKTLEEPPAHGVIILATTELEKIPATISSRAQRFLFKKPSTATIAQKLLQIARAENIALENSAAELIAAAGEGSFRDAESLFDQIASSGRVIDVATVEHVTGRAGFKKVREITEAIVDNDLPKTLELLSVIAREGHNPASLAKDLIHYIRRAIALSADKKLEALYAEDLTRHDAEHLAQLAAKIQPARHIKILKAMIRAYSEMRYSPFAMIPLELILIENMSN